MYRVQFCAASWLCENVETKNLVNFDYFLVYISNITFTRKILSTRSNHTPASCTKLHSVHDQCDDQDLLMYFVDEERAALRRFGGGGDGDCEPSVSGRTQPQAL